MMMLSQNEDQVELYAERCMCLLFSRNAQTIRQLCNVVNYSSPQTSGGRNTYIYTNHDIICSVDSYTRQRL
jgi:hypothetical protein